MTYRQITTRCSPSICLSVGLKSSKFRTFPSCNRTSTVDQELQTDQQFPGLDSNKKDLMKNADGSFDIFFAPKASAGKEANWLQTLPDKGWNMLFRIYGPLGPNSIRGGS
ncbi:DUF1214 domain-containing protein [Pseudomonadota bacterium]